MGVDGVDALRKVVRSDLSGVTIDGDSVLMPKVFRRYRQGIFRWTRASRSRLERPKYRRCRQWSVR